MFDFGTNAKATNKMHDKVIKIDDNNLRNGPDRNDSTERQGTCWNAKKVLTFPLSVLTSDWLKQQKLTKLHKAVHIFILTFQPSSI